MDLSTAIIGALLRLTILLCLAVAVQAQEVSFSREVKPILSDRCFACHGPDEGTRPTPLRLDTPEGAQEAAGTPEASKLLDRVRTDDPARRMPPAYAGHDRLSADEIAILERWVEQGAPWQKHWAFEPPQKAEPPPVASGADARNPIDNFIQARLREEGLAPSPKADRTTLIRRVTLDLTGLPPTPGEVSAFLADESPNAYKKLVQRLLSSPHYGERMAAPWLDAARYADTNGYQTDGQRSMWRWRDWVVDAFNRNKPFDQFTVEQLAGDLLPDPTLDQLIATGFNRNHRTSAEGGIVEEEFRVDYVADRTETTATVWLGLTFGCARCHDHKFDPIQQKDYYSLFAYFNNVPERGLVYNFGNDGPRVKAPTPEQKARLAELDADLARAESRRSALDRKLRKEQQRWEKEIRASDFDAPRSADLVAKLHLDGDYELNGRTGVDDEVRKLKSQPASFSYTDGVFGEAAKLDGDVYIDAGSVAAFNYLDPFTVSLWIRPNKLNGGVISRMQDYDTGSGWGLLLRDGKLRFEFTMRHTDHSMRVDSKRTLDAGEWRHIAITYTGERPSHRGLTLYVDGEPWEFEVEWDDLKWPIGYRGYPLRIGAAAGQRFTGLIDEVRLYGRSLPQTSIAALALPETVSALAAKKKRSPAEQGKLRTAFLETEAGPEVRQAELELADARRRRNKFRDKIPTVMVMEEGPLRQAYILNRGSYDAPGEEVSPAPPEALAQASSRTPNRLGLAQWIVSRDNPLTARVTVNRLWQEVFGVGLVRTSEDFGAQGEPPSHPELLDWLAVEFVDSGWDVKHMVELMVTSAAYRQRSKASAHLIGRDPENRLLARGPRFRLSAQTIRDQALSAAGLLNDEVGGPPVKPYQPAGLWKEVSGQTYQADRGEALYRRSLYTFWKRTVAPPSMVNFDAPDRENCIVRPVRTNTPLQALNLMNDVTYVEAARKLAERMLEAETDAARLQRGFQLVLARDPKPREAETLTRALSEFRARFSDLEQAEGLLAVGESSVDSRHDASELAAFTSAASLLLNLDETVTKQ